VRSATAILAVLSVALALPACGRLIPPSTTPSDVTSDCRYYDDSFVAWQAVGIASGSLSGAVGTAGTLSVTLGDTEGADIALAASGAVLAALAAVSALLTGHYAERYSEECGP
jgi:hypothetical protein